MSGEQWSSRSLGSRFKHEIFYRLIRHLGAWAAYPLLYAVVFYYSLRPSVNRRSRPYLSRRFPAAGLIRRWSQAFRLNLAFGLVLLERAVMGITGRLTFSAPDGSEEIARQLLSEGRGLVVLTAHIGAWQTGLGWLDKIDVPVNLVQRRQDVDVDRHFFEHRPGTRVPKIIDVQEPPSALAAMASALLSGEIVCIMGDRVQKAGASAVKASFLGDDILLPGAPFYLAAKVGAPIAVVFTRRSGPSQVAGKIWKIIRPNNEARAGRPDDILPLVEMFADCLEEYVAAEPYQFFNFYDMWSFGEKYGSKE